MPDDLLFYRRGELREYLAEQERGLLSEIEAAPEEQMPDESLNRKGRALTIAARIVAAGSGAYLGKLFGPGGGAALAQALAEIGVRL